MKQEHRKLAECMSCLQVAFSFWLELQHSGTPAYFSPAVVSSNRPQGRPNEWLLSQPFTSRRSQLPLSCRPHRRSLVDQRITRRKKTLESTTCISFASSHSGLIRYFRKPTPHPGGEGQTRPAFLHCH
jgi:hypothetical protein